MNLANSNFRFVTFIKREQGIHLDALELFPHLSELTLTSRLFQSYAECIASCKRLMEDIKTNINENSEVVFRVGAEVNPAVSGAPTISKDWGPDETARFWIYDQTMDEPGTRRIAAIAKSSVIVVSKGDADVIAIH